MSLARAHLSLHEAARALHVSDQRIRGWIESGDLVLARGYELAPVVVGGRGPTTRVYAWSVQRMIDGDQERGAAPLRVVRRAS